MQLAKGVKDIEPREMILRNKVTKLLVTTFEKYGFVPLQTPIIERLDTLTAKFAAGEESDISKEMFTLTDQGKRKLGLRFDLTVPLARFVAMNPQLKMPFKRYQLGRCYRDGPIKAGRTREFWQYDLDIVGAKSMQADAQVLLLAANAFEALELPVNIYVNSRKLLNDIILQAGIAAKDVENTIICIDKLDKIGSKGVLAELTKRGIGSDKAKAVLDLLNCSGSNQEKLAFYKERLPESEGIAELDELFTLLMWKECFVFNPSLARGQAYYTGPVFEVYSKSDELSCSLGGGGRYDDMIGSFQKSKEIIPATGFSFGMEPILEILKMKGSVGPSSSSQIFIIPVGDVAKDVARITQDLRDKGLNVDVDIMGRNVSKNVKYAKSYGIPNVLFVGEDEIKTGKYKLKNLESGEEGEFTIEEILMKF